MKGSPALELAAMSRTGSDRNIGKLRLIVTYRLAVTWRLTKARWYHEHASFLLNASSTKKLFSAFVGCV